MHEVGDARLRSRGRRVLWLGFALLLAAIAVAQGFVTLHKTSAPGSVFAVYREAGRAVLEGGDPYAVRTESGLRFMYPPLFALLVAPLGALPPRSAALLWYLTGLGLYAVALAAAARLTRPLGGSTLRRVALPFLLTLSFGLYNFSQGQASLLMVAPPLAGLLALERRRERTAGAWLALGAALKPQGAIVALDSAVRREWRTLLAACVWGAVFLLLVPACVLGPAAAWQGLVSFLSVAEHIQSGGEGASYLNQSLRAALERAGYGSAAAPVQWALGLSMLAVTLAASWRWRPPRAFSAGLLFCLVPCLAATGWKHHFLVLLLPFAALVAAWERMPSFVRGLTLAAAGLSLCRVPRLGIRLPLEEMSVVLWTAVVVWLALLAGARVLGETGRQTASDQSASGSPGVG